MRPIVTPVGGRHAGDLVYKKEDRPHGGLLQLFVALTESHRWKNGWNR